MPSTSFLSVLNSISIKLKLFIGFGVVLLLFAVVAWQGYTGLEDASRGFNQYEHTATDANLAGRMQANILLAHVSAIDYANNPNEEILNDYQNRMTMLQGFVETAKTEVKNPERIKLLGEAVLGMGKYMAGVKRLEEIAAESREKMGTMVASGPEMVEKLNKIIEICTVYELFEGLKTATAVQRHLMQGRLAMAYFLWSTHDPADAKKSRDEFTISQGLIKDRDRKGETSQVRNLYKDILKASNMYIEASSAVLDLAAERNEVVETTLHTYGPQIADDFEQIKLSVIKEQEELGPVLQAHNQQLGTTIATIGVVALAVGVIIALFLSLVISSQLGKAMRFAQAIAAGDFSAKLDIRGRDEIARVADAMRMIPETLNKVVLEFKQVSSRVRFGHLEERGDADAFPGSFAEIVTSTNLLADAFTHYLDAVPTPIMAIDNQFHITYMNAQGRELLGMDKQSLLGTKCSDVFHTSDCGTGSCACNVAMKELRKASSETDAHPQGADLEIAYTGVPITDDDGNVVGAFEIIMDQTEIKTTQKRILEVVEQANGLSERLASSADELAAQVEQITKGTSMQRDRVSETASAMEEMNATVMEVAQNASEASKNSSVTRDKALEGADVVRQSVEAIAQVEAAAAELLANMNTLSERSESIGNVMNVISDIADQTNLLALNAAIEAARAGEAGRGFAVVADEVRKLAEKTMNATGEVGASIEAIQEATNKNVDNMHRASDAVQKATDLSGQSGTALQEIVHFMETNAAQVESIATAAEQQSATSEQISRSVEEINIITNDTADSMEQSSNAVQELAGMSNDLSELMRRLGQ
ncbi:PAS domain-containing protein [Oceanidesulfovibrio marinus]|uniref:PAS domain-containing protein n=2 Tax=Oceanidesulfovibrio marinus TaxID=370038 RepID=A0ABX6NBV5_9BACT|nr:PAS domain-containing protein [Oceanidesulfovibrio marinus]